MNQPKRSLKEILEEKRKLQLAAQEEQVIATEIAEGNSPAPQASISQIAIEYVAPTKAEGLTSSTSAKLSTTPVATKNSLLAMLQAKKAAATPSTVAAVPVEEIEENLKPFASQNEAEGPVQTAQQPSVEATATEAVETHYVTEGMLVQQAVASRCRKNLRAARPSA